MSWRTLLILLILAGCAAAPPQPGERFSARVLADVTMEELRPHGAVANALQQGATIDDVWGRRLVSVTCVVSPAVPSRQIFSEARLALAPPGMTDLRFGDHLAISKGALLGQSGPLSSVLHRLPAPRPEELVSYGSATQVALCQEDAAHVLHVRVVRFVEPLEAIQVSLQIRDKLRGLDANDVLAGKIVLLQCSRGEDVDPLFWYARLADGVTARQGAQVEAVAGAPEPIWYGGNGGPFGGNDRASVQADAEAHWPIRLSMVARVIGPLPESRMSYRGIPFCRD